MSKVGVNYTELEGNGSHMFFPERQLMKILDGLLLVPGTTTTTANKGGVVLFKKKYSGCKAAENVMWWIKA